MKKLSSNNLAKISGGGAPFYVGVVVGGYVVTKIVNKIRNRNSGD